jgi:hypothetical protein
MGFPRTVGSYQAFFNGKALPGIIGFCAERQGPGDNSDSGVANHRRLKAGTYPLFTHEGMNARYKTIGYAKPPALGQRPWPCLGVEDTGARAGVLIHCAAGYLMSIGCINLASNIQNASTNLDFTDSWRHVVQLIDSVHDTVGNFPANNNVPIPQCTLVIRGEPDFEVSSDINTKLRTAIHTALRLNEIGDSSPYRLSFASKGKSGASFGATQGDLAAGQPVVTDTFEDALTAAGFTPAEIQQFSSTLSIPLIRNPLTLSDTQRINAALLNSKSLVDAMDGDILEGVFAGVDQCIGAASTAGRHVDPKALIYMALWINMSGPPNKLLIWLRGGDPGMPRVPALGGAVSGQDMEDYLRATRYFTENPENLPHILQSAASGALMLG